MPREIVCKSSEITVGRLTAAKLGQLAVVLTKLPSGEVKAFIGRCPHQGAPLSAGCVTSATVSDTLNQLSSESDGEIVRCPWHGFEWDMKSGLPLVPGPKSSSLRLRFFQVSIEGEDVVLST